MTEDGFRAHGESRIGAANDRTLGDRRSATTDRLDAMFDVFCSSRRRYLLYHLVTVDEDVVELEDGVDAVQSYEAETVGRSPRRNVKTALHHNHLPRLADTSILDYDQRQETIRVTGDERFEAWVEFAQSREWE